MFTGVDFEGTFYIDDNDDDDDFVGFVFGYQDPRHFYVVTWKMGAQVYWIGSPFRAQAESGIILKLVQSETGPGEMLRNSLWHMYDTPNQVKVLWRDPKKMGYQQRVSYRWYLTHRPKIGLIRFWLYQGTQLVTDSGNLFDSTLQGGKIGVYCFSQAGIIWSDLLYKCEGKASNFCKIRYKTSQSAISRIHHLKKIIKRFFGYYSKYNKYFFCHYSKYNKDKIIIIHMHIRNKCHKN